MRAAVLLVAMAGVAHADVCSLDELPARIERLTGRTVDPSVYAAHGGERSVTVEIGDGTRVVSGASCDAALDAAALVIGMAAPEPVVAQAVDRDEPVREVVVAAPVLLLPPVDVVVEGWSVAGGAGLASRGLETTTLGASLRRGGHSFGLEVRAATSADVVVTPAASASVREVSASGMVCGHVSVLAACAVATGGVSYGSSDHLRNAHDGALPLLAFGARLAWEYPQDGRIAIRVTAEGAVRATQTHFDLDDMPVWTSHRLDGLAAGAVVVRFP